MRIVLGLLLLLAASSAAGVTFDLRVVYICKDDGYCWDNDDSVLGYVEKVNLKFVPTGISFRPTIERVVDANYADIKHAEGYSARVQELLALAQGTPDRVTLFLIHSQSPQGDTCWAKPPQWTSSSLSTYQLFCNTGQSGAAVAHELGHYFCLPHTFTFDDPATHPEPVSHEGDGLWETLEDPGVFEDGGDFGDEPDEGPGHEWCEAVDLPDAYGDVVTGSNPGYYPQRGCTTECVQSTSGGTFSIPYAPLGENGLSYFNDCWGPWTHDGTRHEFFVPQQTQRMLTCIADEPERQLLVDACASLGGDSDGDGQCNDDDQCPNHFGLLGKDADEDNDGISDDCDLCTGHPGNGTDTDSDTVCDARDIDDDNDGCVDQLDKHPLEDTVVIGHKIGDRPQCTGPIYGWEGMLVPGQGGKLCDNWNSNDVDNDGIPDSSDYCLLHPGLGCVQAVSCPLPPPHWRLICATGGCNELEFVAVAVSNPGTILVRSRFQIVNGAIYAHASNGMSLFETARVLAGAEPPAQGMNAVAGKAKAEGRRLRFEIRRRDGSVVARVAEVDAANTRLGPLVPADVIVVTTDDRMTQVNVDVSWGNGIAPGTKVPDADRDGIYDASDNCTLVANRDQFDGDNDGYGNRCDPDLDNDGRVTKADSARMAAAVGGIEQPAPVAGREPDVDRFAEGSPVLYSAAADLDGDGRVTFDDQRLWSGLRLGPSGIR